MSISLKIIVVSLIIYSLSLAQKKDIHFEHLTVEEGLSYNTVLSIYQDSRGFLWIGTYNGLDRYDGYKFIHYRNSEEDSTSISDSKIRALCEDNDGNIWVGTWSGGINKFLRDEEKFKRYRHNPDVPNSLSSDGILSICKDKSGNLWIGTEGGGLDYFDIKQESFYHYINNPDDPNSLGINSVSMVYLDKGGTLWCGGKGGLYKFIKEEKRFISINSTDDNQQGICGKNVTTMMEDHLENYWIGTADGGLNKYNPSTNTSLCYLYDPSNPNSLSDIGVQSILEDSDGLFWLGNFNSGLILFDPQKGVFTNYRKEYNDPGSLSDDGIYTIYEDKSHIIWIATWSGGINKYDKNKERFITYYHNPNNINSLSSNNVYGIYKDKSGILWVGTDGGGLNGIDEATHIFTHYRHNPENKSSISSDYVYSIGEDIDGNLWVATYDAGLNRFDRKTNNFQRYQHDPNDPASLGADGISQIFCDSYGDLWVGVYNLGLDRLKRNGEGFIHYRNNPLDSHSVNSKIYTFFEDRFRNLWIGTYGGGLMMYNRKTDDFDFYNKNNSKFSISSNIISSICEDLDGILWVGTGGNGFNRFDRSKKIIKHYSEKDGLLNDIIYGILNDHNGNLWISTGKGISRFNIKNESFTNYDSRNGLQGNDFNQWSYYKARDGRMYFGGTKGFNVFNPDEIINNPYPPKIVITNFMILHNPVAVGYDSLWGRTILEKSITETKRIELNHDDNIISIEFAALDYHIPGKNKYAYYLEGFDKNWAHTDANHRLITYTNLDPGEYTLKVNGSNSDGLWNKTGVSLKIIIHSPWWATWWSYILYGLIFTFIFTGSTRFYLNRQRLRNQLVLEHEHAKKLEEIDELKSSFYANISHEFRTPLMLILGPVEKLISKLADEDGKKQAGLIKGNATRLLRLINQLLDLSKIEAGKLKLRASTGNIAQFIKGLAMEFESIAEQKDINLKLNFEKEDIEAYFDKEKLEKIITNLMSNAVKFTQKGGTLTVSLSIIDHTLEIIVKDTGIGIPKSKLPKVFDRFYQVDGSQTREYEGTGIGLALTKELVELHKGQIFLDSEEGKWTEVSIYLPLGKEHLAEGERIEKDDTEEKEITLSEVEGVKEKIDKEDTLAENLVDKTIVLVVEDNPDVREYIKDALIDVYHVEEAANGEQGLRKAEKYIPDLIVSDIMMPKMDGYEMTRQIKKDEKTSHIPVILLTAKSDKASKLEGLGLGADDYLIKPFDTAELLVRIKNLIDTRKFLQEKFGHDTFVAHKIEKPKFSQIDEVFMGRIIGVIEKNISDEEFSIEDIATEIGMGRTQIYRKIKGLTGKSPSVYLRSVRLARAQEMIQRREATISEISYKVGFSSPAYFSRCFKDEFGYSPSEE